MLQSPFAVLYPKNHELCVHSKLQPHGGKTEKRGWDNCEMNDGIRLNTPSNNPNGFKVEHQELVQDKPESQQDYNY